MSDETKIVRWLILPDIFTHVEDLEQSAVFTVDADETKVARWSQGTDSWLQPEPSAVYTIEGDETKIINWDVKSDTWDGNPKPPTSIIVSSITPTHLYHNQHSGCGIIVKVLLGISNTLDFKIAVNRMDFDTLSQNNARIIPISKFDTGVNLLSVIASDGTQKDITITLEESHRTLSKRTFTAVDGGYTQRNTAFNGVAKIKEQCMGSVAPLGNDQFLVSINKYVNNINIK